MVEDQPFEFTFDPVDDLAFVRCEGQWPLLQPDAEATLEQHRVTSAAVELGHLPEQILRSVAGTTDAKEKVRVDRLAIYSTRRVVAL